VPLVVLPSPYRSLVEPVITYIDRLQQQEPRSLITVVIPEFVPTGWFAKLLHGQASLSLKVRLLFKRGVVTTSIPYHIEAYLPNESDNGGAPQPSNNTSKVFRVLDSPASAVTDGSSDGQTGVAVEPALSEGAPGPTRGDKT
jgi:hypothetical protein